jgi:phenylalanyl-tRNA synthetase beta chain
MKIADSWLREWVDPGLDPDALAHRLTMLGHEVDGVEIQGEGLEGVVVAEVLEVAAHPDADKLSVCKVRASDDEVVDVVCGAPNVVAGMKSALARPGTRLPNGIELSRASIRGVESNGMLCSAAELGLGDESDGIMVLPDDAPVGAELARYLELPDAVFDVDLTPNRGDCFSVLGIARDVATLTGAALAAVDVPAVEPVSEAAHPVELPVPEACPVFAGRVVSGIDPDARTPLWMKERLRRAGLRAIHPVVDVTNYVMLELGQPLHGYDARLIDGPVRPKLSAGGELLTLLDGKEIRLEADTVVITDDSGVIGLAGIMGGLSTAVTDQTQDVFLEAAFWPPAYMAGKARSYGLHTDASLRFERGVDSGGQARALERATGLLIDIAGGEPGPVVVTQAPEHQPANPEINLRSRRLRKLLGVVIGDDAVTTILESLGFYVTETDDGWRVRAPSHRFDIEREVDLIEEVARIYGYDSIPEVTEVAANRLRTVTEQRVDPDTAATLLLGRDYQEAITYSFVDAGDDRALSGTETELVLSNPISSEMSVMRSTLWSGLLRAASANLARQQERVRLFEIGKSFHGSLQAPEEVIRLAGLACGPFSEEQWGAPDRAVDFFDIKGDVEALLALAGLNDEVEYRPVIHPALQPGQAAEIVRDGVTLGLLGKLHPGHARRFDIRPAVYLFELDAERALAASTPLAAEVSRFPAIRRDIAVIVREDVAAKDLVEAVRSASPGVTREVRIFDVYQGPGIEAGLKSVAIGLILQETSRTLTDDDADAAQAAAVKKLHQEFAAVLRD